MVRKQGPCVTAGLGLGGNLDESRKKIIPVGIVAEDSPALNAAADNVVQSTWKIDPSLAWHNVIKFNKTYKVMGVPLYLKTYKVMGVPLYLYMGVPVYRAYTGPRT
ncbi:hypothetical protein LPW11_06805 [Geomonas sp. RF6]|uniref:hypothetical protein n=1 Tax=Geomonas sp. RF6 TaxID=2897342 RepID=UPI001E4EBAAA|nr:hypothetical protein [Geomonas sp. RF6]UFS72883.1 hypothetical protein LPW11_06805 [Geomonas sp. RF6]